MPKPKDLKKWDAQCGKKQPYDSGIVEGPSLKASHNPSNEVLRLASLAQDDERGKHFAQTHSAQNDIARRSKPSICTL